MYRTCISCHEHLGMNTVLPTFPVGQRLAFDAERGRLWVVCIGCGRWNLTPLEERWETIEECERLFRQTALRFCTENIGLAQLSVGLELVRVGTALRPELAAWRYGRVLQRRVRSVLVQATDRALSLAGDMVSAGARRVPRLRLRYDAPTWVRIHRQRERIIDVVPLDSSRSAVLRYRHLETAALVRPARREQWSLVVRHEQGTLDFSGAAGLRTAGKLLAAMNGSGATTEQIRYAVQKVEDAGNPDGYFARVVALALRTSWGRNPDAPRGTPVAPVVSSETEKLALYLTGRSFWGRGGTGSEALTLLPRLPMVDRLALEMAANEDSERRALDGELAELEDAWRQAEEIASIADEMFRARTRPLPLLASARALLSPA